MHLRPWNYLPRSRNIPHFAVEWHTMTAGEIDAVRCRTSTRGIEKSSHEKGVTNNYRQMWLTN